jgi:hypothetical protein
MQKRIINHCALPNTSNQSTHKGANTLPLKRDRAKLHALSLATHLKLAGRVAAIRWASGGRACVHKVARARARGGGPVTRGQRRRLKPFHLHRRAAPYPTPSASSLHLQRWEGQMPTGSSAPSSVARGATASLPLQVDRGVEVGRSARLHRYGRGGAPAMTSY